MIRCMGCMKEVGEKIDICPHCGYVVGESVKEAYYLIPGTVLNQKYIVGKVLGYGGFGVTYVGWDTDLNRKVAIKEYLPSDFATRVLGETKLTAFSGDQEEQFQIGLKSFVSEARKLARFHNIAEIVDIYDYFLENDTGYIVMEFLYGQTVKELLKGNRAFSSESAIQIVKSVLCGLEAVHREGIIHRDISPDNIFITQQDEIRLLDFGAARYAVNTHSRSLSVILKPGYAPEEQYRSKGEQGPWTDVYGAAASLYRMITGIRPQESIERMIDDQVKPPSEMGIEISESIENALMNALNVRKKDRIQSAEEFRQALESDLVERFVVIADKGEPMKLSRRTKILLSAAAVAGVLLVGMVMRSTISAFSWNQIQESELKEGEVYLTDITGMSYEEAQKSLKDVCNLVIIGKNYSTTVPYNKIISQDPEAGRVIHKGEKVEVTMSGGTQEVMMPDLESLLHEEALSVIESQGLMIQEKDITYEYNDMVEKGRVYEQSIAAGEKLTPGSEVSISVSLGRLEEETAILEVPDLIGKTKQEATAILEALKKTAGFTYPLGNIEKRYSAEIPEGQIMEQSLQPGTKVRTNAAIELVISQGPKMVKVPDVLYMKKEDAITALEALNLMVTTKNTYSSSVESGSVVSQSLEAGKNAAEGSSITIGISIGSKPETSTPSGGSSGGQNAGGEEPDWQVENGDANWVVE